MTLNKALQFLEERAGIVFGESRPATQRDFERVARDLGKALDQEFPPFRAAEALAVSRFIGYVFMPTLSARERDAARTHAVRAMRALLGRLPKGLPDAQAVEGWLAFYEKGKKKTVVIALKTATALPLFARLPKVRALVSAPLVAQLIEAARMRRYAEFTPHTGIQPQTYLAIERAGERASALHLLGGFWDEYEEVIAQEVGFFALDRNPTPEEAAKADRLGRELAAEWEGLVTEEMRRLGAQTLSEAVERKRAENARELDDLVRAGRLARVPEAQVLAPRPEGWVTSAQDERELTDVIRQEAAAKVPNREEELRAFVARWFPAVLPYARAAFPGQDARAIAEGQILLEVHQATWRDTPRDLERWLTDSVAIWDRLPKFGRFR